MKLFQSPLGLGMICTEKMLLDSQLTHRNTPAIKLGPWSDYTVFGNPASVKNLIKCLTIVAAHVFLRGMASGNLVKAHIIVNMYWFSVLVLTGVPHSL